jgi:glycosyltransferase involved in cell wall biosynthesis
MRIGVTGEVIPCDTPDQLASTLIALLQDSDRRERMAAAARQHAVEHFDWRIAAARAHAAFDRAARPELVPVA